MEEGKDIKHTSDTPSHTKGVLGFYVELFINSC
jgi:hypothetical protein